MTERLSEQFINNIMFIAGLPRVLTWEEFQSDVEDAFWFCSAAEMDWLERVWDRMVAEGQATCSSVLDYPVIVTRLLALIAFYDDFLLQFAQYHHELDFRKLAGNLGAPEDLMVRLVVKQYCLVMLADPAEVLADVIHQSIIPVLLREFESREWLTTKMYLSALPTCWEDEDPDFLQDLERQEPEHFTERKGYQEVLKWVEARLSSG
jgi:hypothetical protein